MFHRHAEVATPARPSRPQRERGKVRHLVTHGGRDPEEARSGASNHGWSASPGLDVGAASLRQPAGA